jgi:DnaJ-domain-containing protein 1
MASISEPRLPAVDADTEAFAVLGISLKDSEESAKLAFHHKLKLYSPERWTGPDVPFEFSRYAAEKTRQINMAFTIARAAIQSRAETQRLARSQYPLFGGLRATA